MFYFLSGVHWNCNVEASRTWTLNCKCAYVHGLMGFWNFLFTDILQPQYEQDLRCGSMCIGWSFASESESSGARVSPVSHVLHMYMHFLRSIFWDSSVHLWSHALLTYDDRSKESSPFLTKNCKSIYLTTLCYFNISHILNTFVKIL